MPRRPSQLAQWAGVSPRAQPVSPGLARGAAASISPTRPESPSVPGSEVAQHQFHVLERLPGAEATPAAKLGQLAKAVEHLPVDAQLRIIESSLVGKSAARQWRADEYVRLQAEREEAEAAGEELDAEIRELEKVKQALLSKQSQQSTAKSTDLEAAALQAVAAKVEEAGTKQELKSIIALVRGQSPSPEPVDEKEDVHAKMDRAPYPGWTHRPWRTHGPGS